MKRYIVEATLIDEETSPAVRRTYRHVVKSDSKFHAENKIRGHYARVQEVWSALRVELHTKVMS